MHTSASTTACDPSGQHDEPDSTAALRDQTCAIIDDLDHAAKGRASIVRSCTELSTISDADRESLKELLRCITEQRKRLRAIRRLWQSIDAFERPSAGLVESTRLCLQESREIASAIEPWRAQTISKVRGSVPATWARLTQVAQHFLAATDAGQVVRGRAGIRVVP